MAVKNPSIVPVSELTAKQAEAEHARLTAEIAQHDKRYYQEDRPSITDAENDALRVRYDAIIDLQEQVKGAVMARAARGAVHGYDRSSVRESVSTLLRRLPSACRRVSMFGLTPVTPPKSLPNGL